MLKGKHRAAKTINREQNSKDNACTSFSGGCTIPSRALRDGWQPVGHASGCQRFPAPPVNFWWVPLEQGGSTSKPSTQLLFRFFSQPSAPGRSFLPHPTFHELSHISSLQIILALSEVITTPTHFISAFQFVYIPQPQS